MPKIINPIAPLNNWRESAMVYMLAIEFGTRDEKESAKASILKMANLADSYERSLISPQYETSIPLDSAIIKG